MSKFVMGRRAIAWVRQQRGKRWLNGLPLVVAIALLGGWAWLQMPDYDNPDTARATAPKNLGQSEVYEAVEVLDGDTIKLPNGQKVRLCGIDAPEKEQPLGPESTANLQRLVDAAGGAVMVQENARDRYGRIVGEVFTQQGGQEQHLNAEQLMGGMAYVYPQYIAGCDNGDVMKDTEKMAQEGRKGVWAGNYQRPWEYRQAKR